MQSAISIAYFGWGFKVKWAKKPGNIALLHVAARIKLKTELKNYWH